MKALEEALRSNSKLRQQVKIAREALAPFASVGKIVRAGWGPQGITPESPFVSGTAWRDKNGETKTLLFSDFETARLAALKLMDHPDAG